MLLLMIGSGPQIWVGTGKSSKMEVEARGNSTLGRIIRRAQIYQWSEHRKPLQKVEGLLKWPPRDGVTTEYLARPDPATGEGLSSTVKLWLFSYYLISLQMTFWIAYLQEFNWSLSFSADLPQLWIRLFYVPHPPNTYVWFIRGEWTTIEYCDIFMTNTVISSWDFCISRSDHQNFETLI